MYILWYLNDSFLLSSCCSLFCFFCDCRLFHLYVIGYQLILTFLFWSLFYLKCSSFSHIFGSFLSNPFFHAYFSFKLFFLFTVFFFHAHSFFIHQIVYSFWYLDPHCFFFQAAERTRTIDRGYKEAKEFSDAYTDLNNWLENAVKPFDETAHTLGKDPDKIKQLLQKHKEF